MMTSSSYDDREERRLEALDRYELLDTAPEDDFDQMTRRAARKLRAPIAAIGLVASDRVWLKARTGLDLHQMTLRERRGEGSPLLPREGCWLPDLEQEDCDVPPELAGEGIRFYAAAPLRTYNGFVLGVLAVMDRTPRERDEGQLAELERLASKLMKEIETRRLARRLARCGSLPDRGRRRPRTQTLLPQRTPAESCRVGERSTPRWTRRRRGRPMNIWLPHRDYDLLADEAGQLGVRPETMARLLLHLGLRGTLRPYPSPEKLSERRA
jgi:hypothetical protein